MIAKDVDQRRDGLPSGRSHLTQRLGSVLANLIVLILEGRNERGNGRLRLRPDFSQRVGGIPADLNALIVEQFLECVHSGPGVRTKASQGSCRSQLILCLPRLEHLDQSGNRLLCRWTDSSQG